MSSHPYSRRTKGLRAVAAAYEASHTKSGKKRKKPLPLAGPAGTRASRRTHGIRTFVQRWQGRDGTLHRTRRPATKGNYLPALVNVIVTNEGERIIR